MDASVFLHAQFSNDLIGLAPDQAQLSTYCTPKGRMIADFVLWRASEHCCRILLPRSLCQPVLQRLQMFQLRSEVELIDQSDSHALFGLAGKANDFPGALLDAPLGVAECEGMTTLAWPGVPLRWVLSGPRERLETQIKDIGTPMFSSELWELMNIESGIPFVVDATREKFVPQHLNLDLLHAISFDKGCYPGQEVVARMHYRGQVKFRTYLLTEVSGSSLPSGADIYLLEDSDPEPRPCGQVVSARCGEDGTTRILASIRVADADKSLCVGHPDGPPADLQPPPYSLEAS